MLVIMFPDNYISSSPTDEQLTIHKDNYEASYGAGSFVRDLYEDSTGATMSNLILHYGFSRMMEYVHEYKIAG